MDRIDFLVKDYELKTRYLSDHFQRMWTRFNFFVTIESALAGGKFLFGGPTAGLTRGIAALGVVLSVIWYVFGAEDRYLVRIYRRQVQDAGKKAAGALLDDTDAGAYRPVGEIEVTAKDLRADGKAFDSLSGWRVEALSTTRLAALFPLLLLIGWAGLLLASVA
jgi:hypothetical protein